MSEKSKYFKKFFPFNFKYSKKNKGILIGDRIQNDANIRSLILMNNLNKQNNLNSYLLSDLNDKDNIPIYKYLDIKKYSINFKLKDLRFFFIFSSTIFDFLIFYFKTLFLINKIDWLIQKFKCKKINIGDLVYDLYIRYNLKFLNPSIYEFKFAKLLFIGILKTHFIDYLVKKYKIKIIVSTQISYTSYGNLMLRYGTKFKLKTFLTGYNFIQKYNNHNEALSSPFKIRENKIKKNISQFSKNKIEKFYNLRKKGKSQGYYVPIDTMKKIYGINEDYKIIKFVKKINKLKQKHKINILAAHCFADSPHLCAEMIFRDYYDQFLQTINFIRKYDKNTFWIIKPHPARSEYNEDGIIEDIIQRYKSELDNVIICPKKINNTTLFNLSDNLVNCVSTISLEYACNGKRSILAGDAPYFHKNLFYKPKNKIEYFNLIKNLDKIKINLNSKEIILAKRILYIFEKEAFNNLEKSKVLPDIFLSKIKDKDYLKHLNNNIKRSKNVSIYDDPFYESLHLELSKINF